MNLDDVQASEEVGDEEAILVKAFLFHTQPTLREIQEHVLTHREGNKPTVIFAERRRGGARVWPSGNFFPGDSRCRFLRCSIPHYFPLNVDDLFSLSSFAVFPSCYFTIPVLSV